MAHIQANHPAPAIPIARGGPLTDQVLEAILPAARNAPVELSVALGEFMLISFAPLVDEVLQLRRQMALIHDVADPANVVRLHPGEC